MTEREQLEPWVTALLGDETFTGAVACVRWRTRDARMAQDFLPADDTRALAALLLGHGQRTDTYMAVAPRTRPAGGAEAIDRVHALWVDCDAPEAVAALQRFTPAPSMVIRTSEHGRHAYWVLSEPLAARWVRQANLRLAHALGADPRATDVARIMRPPGTLNFKRGDATPVELERATGEIFPVRDLVGGLPDPAPVRPAISSSRNCSSTRSRSGRSGLDRIPASAYVVALTGRDVGRDGKTLCPFHHETTPSLHAYDDPERGWTCFGCGRGGTIIDFGAHLFGIEPRGRGYWDIRRGLEQRLLAHVSEVAS